MNEQFNFNRGAISPIQCLNDGCEMLKGQYGAFLGVMIVGFLIMLVGACIPLAPLVPPMICGLYLCLFAMMNRQPFNTGTLFKGFEFFGQSFVASLVLSIPIFVLSIIMQIGLGGMSAVVDALKVNKNPRPEDIFPVLFGFFGFILGMYLLIIVVALILGMLTAFVYPLIVERKLGAIDALKLSVRAVMGNFFGVVGLMLLGQLLIIAGVMFFYVGALFVAPVVFAAWAIAYRRVFPLQISQPSGQIGAPQQYSWSPPISTSKAGLVLTLSALAIVGLGVLSFAGIGFFAYRGITQAIEKAEQERKLKEISAPIPPYSFPSPTPDSLSGEKTVKAIGLLDGKAIDLPKPEYPSAARAVRASGVVNVLVTVDENGSVVSATAVSGHPLLRPSAVQAARSAKFSPTLVGGKQLKITGIIIYNFSPE